MCNNDDHNPNLDLVSINAYATFGQIPSICSQDIKRQTTRNHGMTDNLKTVYPLPHTYVVCGGGGGGGGGASNSIHSFSRYWAEMKSVTDGMTDNLKTEYPTPYFVCGGIQSSDNPNLDLQKLTCNNPNLDLVNINAYAKIG